MNWYILKVAKGKDNKAKTDVENMIRNFGYEHAFAHVIAPTEKYVDVKAGKRVTKERPLLAGYLLVEADLSATKAIRAVLAIKDIHGFMCEEKNVPTKVPKREVDRLMGQMTDINTSGLWMVGEKVKIILGPFANFEGNITKTDEIRSKANVEVKIFGRATDVELHFDAITKL